MMAVLWIVLALVLLWVAVLVIRAVRFVPKAAVQAAPVAVAVDGDEIARKMQAMIQCPTVSFVDREMEDAEAFARFPELLRALFPAVHKACPQERIGERGLLYRWKGKRDKAPSVCMAHYDVVPVDAAGWRKPPFEGVIEDGVLWGRGTLDTKCTLMGVMQAAEMLIAEGFVPENDVYLAFGGDEEISGGGAPGIVAELKRRGVVLAFVLDEGGAVVEKVFPGVRQPAALVGVGEKGSAMVTFTAKSAGGHASAPPPHTVVGRLAKAVTQIEEKPFPFRLTPPARALFDTLGRHSTFVYRLIFANLWCFAPLLNMICKKSGGEMNALVRTTCAFTQMRGSEAGNVLPPSAQMTANVRIIGGETKETVLADLRKRVPDDAVKMEIEGSDPSPASRTEGEAWTRLEGAIAQTWPGALVSPYLMVAASDSRHYAQISENVYRFCPMALSGEERALIHGHDERIPLEKLETIVRFYVRLMRAC